jgi:hypothetical protein
MPVGVAPFSASGVERRMCEDLVFTEAMMIRALEANGWFDAWDIYWTRAKEFGDDWGGLTLRDAFEVLLREKNILPPAAKPGVSPIFPVSGERLAGWGDRHGGAQAA